MKDYLASVEKLRSDAAEAALVRDLATDGTKREMYGRLHDHLNRLADEVQRVVNGRTGAGEDLEKNREQQATAPTSSSGTESAH